MLTLANLDSQLVVFGVAGVIAVVAILAGMIKSVIRTRAREQSRREIAAYIAEGSMTPEQGERLMKANPDDDHSCCA